MKKFLLILVLCFPVIAFAQSSDYYIYNIVSFRGEIDGGKFYSNKKDGNFAQDVSVKIDDGSKISFLHDADGKPIVFKTPAAALMYFVSQGWEIYDNGAYEEGEVLTGTGSSSSTTYWVIRKQCTKEEFEAAVESGIKK